MIEKETRVNIRSYLQGFVRGLIDAHRPEKRAGRVAERRVTYS